MHKTYPLIIRTILSQAFPFKSISKSIFPSLPLSLSLSHSLSRRICLIAFLSKRLLWLRSLQRFNQIIDYFTLNWIHSALDCNFKPIAFDSYSVLKLNIHFIRPVPFYNLAKQCASELQLQVYLYELNIDKNGKTI